MARLIIMLAAYSAIHSIATIDGRTMLYFLDHIEIRLLAYRGKSKREIAKITGRDRKTVQKVLAQRAIGPIQRSRESKLDGHKHLIEQLMKSNFETTRKLYEETCAHGYTGSIRAFRRYLGQNSLLQHIATASEYRKTANREKEHLSFDWVQKLQQGKIHDNELAGEFGMTMSLEDIRKLLQSITKGQLRFRNRAVTIFASLKGIPNRMIAKFLFVDRTTVRDWILNFETHGLDEIFGIRRQQRIKSEDPRFVDAVFSILHSPPSSRGYNRTSWRMSDIHSEMSKQGLPIAKNNIRKIIKNAGYKFKKAKKVLTSNDPKYHEKLEEITRILSNLAHDERFFSVDEFGPFAIKIRGGKALAPPGKVRTVPQYQKSKGRLIVTAALELSSNQVTHFYSERKNTTEMIKLLDRILERYSGCKCIYFSWDAASWHASKKLYDRVGEVNSQVQDGNNSYPMVKLAPLPTSSQFLNVIESVFSGLARAIIHNSDYQSVDECKSAIDQYFLDRNKHFQVYPKRAGNKIWGKERTAAKFDESNNCKDPMY